MAVIASACYGIILARKHHMDFVGVFSLALIAAFGGGTLRDLFLDRHPLFWIREEHYSLIIFVLALGTSFIPKLPGVIERSLYIPDALGLGLFSIVGATAALESGTSLFVASLLGVITGTFGGVIGDVICNQVPSLFRTAPLFATCSFSGCWILFMLQALRIQNAIATPIAITVIVIMRIAAVHYQWKLPQIENPTDETSKPTA